MMLAVTVRKALEDRYRASGYQRIRASLNKYSAAAEAPVVALDDADDMNTLNLSAVTGSEPGTLLLSLRAVQRRMSGVDSILLVGSDSIFPHWRMTNPVTDRSIDPDETVLSDNPYGTDTEDLEEYLAPPLAVGRLTDFPRGSADDFVKLIDAATSARSGRTARSRSAVVSNADWADYSRKAAVALPGQDWHLSPGYLMNQADTDREFLYFNLHGFAGQADWEGYDTVQGRFVTAVTPDAFDQQYISGEIGFTEYTRIQLAWD